MIFQEWSTKWKVSYKYLQIESPTAIDSPSPTIKMRLLKSYNGVSGCSGFRCTSTRLFAFLNFLLCCLFVMVLASVHIVKDINKNEAWMKPQNKKTIKGLNFCLLSYNILSWAFLIKKKLFLNFSQQISSIYNKLLLRFCIKIFTAYTTPHRSTELMKKVCSKNISKWKDGGN